MGNNVSVSGFEGDSIEFKCPENRTMSGGKIMYGANGKEIVYKIPPETKTLAKSLKIDNSTMGIDPIPGIQKKFKGEYYCTNQYSFKGTFNDKEQRAIPTLLSSNVKTIDECITLAKKGGYSTIGLQNGNQCFAGNAPRYSQYGGANGCTAELGCAWINQVYNINVPVPYNGNGFINGPWIGTPGKPNYQVNINDTIYYILIEGIHVKFVSANGDAKYYVGKIENFDLSNWNAYIPVQKGMYIFNLSAPAPVPVPAPAPAPARATVPVSAPAPAQAPTTTQTVSISGDRISISQAPTSTQTVSTSGDRKSSASVFPSAILTIGPYANGQTLTLRGTVDIINSDNSSSSGSSGNSYVTNNTPINIERFSDNNDNQIIYQNDNTFYFILVAILVIMLLYYVFCNCEKNKYLMF